MPRRLPVLSLGLLAGLALSTLGCPAEDEPSTCEATFECVIDMGCGSSSPAAVALHECEEMHGAGAPECEDETTAWNVEVAVYLECRSQCGDDNDQEQRTAMLEATDCNASMDTALLATLDPDAAAELAASCDYECD